MLRNLVYIPDTEIVQHHELVWVELTGKMTPLEIPDANFLNLSMSPDGSRFFFTVGNHESDIWVMDLRDDGAGQELPEIN